MNEENFDSLMEKARQEGMLKEDEYHWKPEVTFHFLLFITKLNSFKLIPGKKPSTSCLRLPDWLVT